MHIKFSIGYHEVLTRNLTDEEMAAFLGGLRGARIIENKYENGKSKYHYCPEKDENLVYEVLDVINPLLPDKARRDHVKEAQATAVEEEA